jgi:tRNA(His) 5'-end guanylyltransferase
MRQHEVFLQVRIPPGMWTVLRLDGRAFHKVTEACEKPFDMKFHDCIVAAAKALVLDLGPVYAYIQSDEISVVFLPSFDLFDRRMEKLVSVASGIVTSTFVLRFGHAAGFDCRVWLGAKQDDVVDYFSWRLADCDRNALNGLAQKCIRDSVPGDISPKEVHARLFRLKRGELHKLIHKSGIEYSELSLSQRNGTEIGLQLMPLFTRLEHVAGEQMVGVEYYRNPLVRDVTRHGVAYREELSKYLCEVGEDNHGTLVPEHPKPGP